MSPLEQAMSFVHVASQRTGYITDGPWGTYDLDAPRENGRKPYVQESVFYAVKWDDTGEDGEVFEHQIEHIRPTQRHITDGIRACWCNPTIMDGVLVHHTEEEQSN